MGMGFLSKIRSFIRNIISDGYKFVGICAPLLSIAFTASKFWEVNMQWIKDLSYAWAFLPLIFWLFIAYSRRWLTSQQLEEDIQKLKEELENKKPNLQLRIERIGFGDNDSGVIMTVEIAVKNLGAPTIAEGWNIEIVSPNKETIKGQLIHFQDPPLILKDFNLELTPDKAIYNKTLIPIPTGGLIGGFIAYSIKGAKVGNIPLGSEIMISCVDINGKKCSATAVFTEGKKEFTFIPTTGITPS